MNNSQPPLITISHLQREAWIYLRQSTEIQVSRNRGSTAYQRQQEKVARALGWPQHLIKIADRDLGKSGSSTEQREDWNEMLKAIAANRVGAVFVVNISRLSRQLIDFEKLRNLASFHDVLLVLDGRVVNPADPGDTVMTQLSARNSE